MTKTATKTNKENEPAATTPTAATFLDLFKAREHLAQLKQMHFPPKTAVKVWRILKQLDVDLLPMVQQYERLIVKYGTAVEGEPGMVKVSPENIVKFNNEFEPLLIEPLTAEIERLTFDELGQAEAAITPALLDAIWFILEIE